MQKIGLLLLLGMFALLSPLVILSVAASTGGATQYATYSVTATNSTSTYSATVNESITPSTNGMSDISLQLVTSLSNLSYSRLVNSTYAMFPILPISGNQSFSYQTQNYSIAFTLVETGSGSATVSGAQYTTTNYDFSVSGSGHSLQVSATGSLSVLPSGLVYSATVIANGTMSAHAQLVTTNLPLASTSSSSSTMQKATIAGGTSAAVFGVGALVFYRHHKATHLSQAGKDKPLYHVD
ncbi:MAG: hypothetical protein JRN20_05135 [Nitrososphaerota archaeon]|jgi:3'-phosphoadenosine 5'-phosphosulfate (PAPS) 3'-phosphatase|nr:hypothetical protein [Nitrososphaerota archaeon]MDG6922476.1 hypothetical protein [Nitrososphaerota archaeon]